MIENREPLDPRTHVVLLTGPLGPRDWIAIPDDPEIQREDRGRRVRIVASETAPCACGADHSIRWHLLDGRRYSLGECPSMGWLFCDGVHPVFVGGDA